MEPEGDGPVSPTRIRLNESVIVAISGYAMAGGLDLALWSRITPALLKYYGLSNLSLFNHLCSSITFIIILFFEPAGCPDRASLVNFPKIALRYFIRMKPGLSSKFLTSSISCNETSNINSLSSRNLQIRFVSVRMISAKLKDALISLTQHRPV